MEGKNYPIIYDREDGIENAHCLITPFIGPSTYEEAIARIEEAERYIENGDVYDWEDVLKEASLRTSRKMASAMATAIATNNPKNRETVTRKHKMKATPAVMNQPPMTDSTPVMRNTALSRPHARSASDVPIAAMKVT